MTEAEFGRHFVDFLINEKGYPKGSILLEASLADSRGEFRRYIADLILLDTDFNNYLALIEFKGRIKRATNDSLHQVKTYLNVLDKPNLPAYLVVPRNGNENLVEFRIYILDENDWREIEKEDFPHYETLRSKNQADEKKEFKDINESKLKDVKNKKELITGTAWSTLASLMVAIITAILISLENFFGDHNNSNSTAVTCCDSLETSQERLSYKILSLEKSLLDIKREDSLIRTDGNAIQLSMLNVRIKNVENLLNQSPERLLKVQELTFQIQELKLEIGHEKELSDNKLTNLKDRIDQLTIWTSGLIITIIGSIIGFAVNAFRKS